MISSIVIILFSVVSLIGVIALLFKRGREEDFEWNVHRTISVTLFTVTHLLFLVVGILHLFMHISIVYVTGVMIAVLVSRAYNGRSLYGKNHWKHYVVNTALMIFIIALF